MVRVAAAEYAPKERPWPECISSPPSKPELRTRLTDTEGEEDEADLQRVVSVLVRKRPRTCVRDRVAEGEDEACCTCLLVNYE